MAEVKLTGSQRSRSGKGNARQLRRAGRIPAILYGSQSEAMSLDVDASELGRIVAGGGSGRLLSLEISNGGGSASKTVILKEVQKDPVQGNLLHVDFHEVALDKEIDTTVWLHIVGEEDRPRDEGILNISLRELEVSCLPTAIPDEIRVDVSTLNLGDSLSVGDLQLPAGVTSITEADETVVSVVAPTEEPVEEEVDAEAEEGAEAEAAGEDAAEAADEETDGKEA